MAISVALLTVTSTILVQPAFFIGPVTYKPGTVAHRVETVVTFVLLW